MDRSFTTYIVGAGALGVMYAHIIHAAGFPVSFVANGVRVHRLRTEGTWINGAKLEIPVVDVDVDKIAPADLVIVAVKSYQLGDICSWIASLVSSSSAIISVMNGIESEELLADSVGSEPVFPAIAVGMDAVREGNEVTFTQAGRIVFGRLRNDPNNLDAQVVRIQEFFSAVGISWETPPDVERALWNKFMLNVGVNQVSALLGAPYGVFHHDTRARNLMRLAMGEVLVLAEREHVDLKEADIDAWFPVVETLSANGKTSMLQDVEAGRKTEVEVFAGKVVELGRKHDIATPVNQVLLFAIQIRESR